MCAPPFELISPQERGAQHKGVRVSRVYCLYSRALQSTQVSKPAWVFCAASPSRARAVRRPIVVTPGSRVCVCVCVCVRGRLVSKKGRCEREGRRGKGNCGEQQQPLPLHSSELDFDLKV